MMRTKVLMLWFIAILCGTSKAQMVPIAHGHAHNDYTHPRPLLQALENGFTSIEVDVYLHHDQLVVSHLPLGLSRKKNIQQLYLDPLRKIIQDHHGWVYEGVTQPVILMIDFKTDGTATYSKLEEILSDYRDIISVYRGDSVIMQKPVNILISGSSPVASLSKEDSAPATVDAGIVAIENPAIRKVATRFSSAWGSYFTWRGVGRMPDRQLHQLRALVSTIHAYHKEIRFWAIPDQPKVWELLLREGVDWINTNHLKAYHWMMMQHPALN